MAEQRSAKAIGILSLLALVGCDSVSPHEVRRVQSTVIHVVKDQGPMGCMGTDWSTRIRLDDGSVRMLCGSWGPVGTVIPVSLMSDGSIRL